LEILGHRLHVAHAPHRWYALEEKEHGVNQLRVVGGVYDCCLEAAMQFYNGNSISCVVNSSSSSNDSRSSICAGNNSNSNSNNNNQDVDEENNSSSSNTNTTITRRSLGIPMHPVSKIDIAEMTKPIENAHRYLQIAFAEDLYL